MKDENKNLTSRSWFWKHLKNNAKYCTLELRDLSINNIRSQINLCKRKIKLN